MTEYLPTLLFAGGFGHLSLLFVAALLPSKLRWRRELADLPRLHRQMHWVYAGYVVLSFVAFGVISLLHSDTLAGGSGLARTFCGYVAVFWSIRLTLQAVFDVRDYLTAWWLRLGYHALTLLFVSFTLIYGYAALHPQGGVS